MIKTWNLLRLTQGGRSIEFFKGFLFFLRVFNFFWENYSTDFQIWPRAICVFALPTWTYFLYYSIFYTFARTHVCAYVRTYVRTCVGALTHERTSGITFVTCFWIRPSYRMSWLDFGIYLRCETFSKSIISKKCRAFFTFLN